jgi:hypothetical protein
VVAGARRSPTEDQLDLACTFHGTNLAVSAFTDASRTYHVPARRSRNSLIGGSAMLVGMGAAHIGGAGVEVLVLGPAQCTAGGTALTVERPLERALLVRLALAAGTPVADERLQRAPIRMFAAAAKCGDDELALSVQLRGPASARAGRADGRPARGRRVRVAALHRPPRGGDGPARVVRRP